MAPLLCPCWVLGLAMLIRLPLFLCMHGSRWGHPYTSDWIDHGTLKGKDRDVLPLRVQENCENTERFSTNEHIYKHIYKQTVRT